MRKIKISFIDINQERYYELNSISSLISGSIDIVSFKKHIMSINFLDSSSTLKYISINGLKLLAELNPDILVLYKMLQHTLSENQIDMKHHIMTLYV